MPVELRLEFMPVISADFPDAERKFVDDVINEVDGIGLCVFLVDFKGAYAGTAIRINASWRGVNGPLSPLPSINT